MNNNHRPPPDFILRLMAYKLANSSILKGEDELSHRVANYLREQSILRGGFVWSHVPNEGKRTKLIGAIKKAMGMIPGTPDFLFMWRGGAGFIELKIGNKKQTDSQRDFEKWCRREGVHYSLCHSQAEVHQTLKEWGLV